MTSTPGMDSACIAAGAGGRHRRGRPVHDLLAAHAHSPVSVPRPRSSAENPNQAGVIQLPLSAGKPAAPLEFGPRAGARIVLGELVGPRLYSAASQARRDGLDAVVALTGSAARVRDAGATRRRVARPLQQATTHLQRIDGLLQKALTDLDLRRTEHTTAEHRYRQLRSQGGQLWASPPTTRALRDRVGWATLAVRDAETMAARLITALHRAATDAQLLARHIDVVADHALARPPAVLHLVRVLLPRSERRDWWRELSSTLAETRSHTERRTHLRSYLTAAPRTIWTSWAVARDAASGTPRTTTHPRKGPIRVVLAPRAGW
jgi:hypothetical protein